jgi:hypothetical protein
MGNYGTEGREFESLRARKESPAKRGGSFASIAFDGTVLSGSLPPRQLRLVRRWASQHQSELEANWERSRRRDPLLTIDPLA